MSRKTDETARIVAALDETRRAEYFRDPDRPDAKFLRSRRGRQHPDVVRAQARVRVANWRVQQDRRGAPTTAQVGMALVSALATASLAELTASDHALVGRMLQDLVQRGFDIQETKAVLRRLRNRLVDPADHAGEPGDSTDLPVQPLF